MNAKFTQRMPDELHKRIEALCDDYGVSMNTLVNMACEEYLKTGRLPDLEEKVSKLEKEVKELKGKK